MFYFPENTGETGEVWTFEGKASAPLSIWDISLGGAVGQVAGEEDAFDDYTYWNIGLSKIFKEHFTVDVRYWDTDVDGDPLAGERIVGTVSFS